MEYMVNFYNSFSALLQTNPIVAGAFSLWGLAVISFLCIRLPKYLLLLIKRYFTVSLEIRSFSFNDKYEHVNFYSNQFMKFHEWIQKQKIIYSRTRQLNKSQEKNSAHITLGIGNHIIFAKGTFFYISFSELESNNTQISKFIVSITCFGISNKKFEKIINEFKIVDDKIDKLPVRLNEGTYWGYSYYIRIRSRDTVILNKDLKDKIFKSFEHFFNNSKFYYERGLNYKKVILLWGPPGTGKTSLIKSLASTFSKEINLFSLSECTSNMFRQAVINCDNSKSILVIEDVDTLDTLLDREKRDNSDEFKKLTLADILNVLDGINTPDGAIFILTANNIDNIDKAILRSCRIDETYYFGLLDDAEIREYSKLVYPDIELQENIIYKQIAGSDLQAKFLESNGSMKIYLDGLQQISQ